MKTTILLLSLLILPQTTQAADGTENYCHDKVVVKQWESMVKKTPNDLVLQHLHALRLGICLKVKNQTQSFFFPVGISSISFSTVAIFSKNCSPATH